MRQSLSHKNIHNSSLEKEKKNKYKDNLVVSELNSEYKEKAFVTKVIYGIAAIFGLDHDV